MKNVCYRMVLMLLLWAATVFAQTTAELRGVVTDPSGAVIPGASVTVAGAGGFTKTAGTDEFGKYAVTGLAPGKYTVRVTSAGFTPFEARNVELRAGKTVTLETQLVIETQVQTVTVADLAAVSVDPQSTAGAIVLRGQDLEVLSDNPDDLASDLQALAGPSAGPNGGEIFIDGFSGGKLPPKSSIREVRINQNPFSAEYDRLGFGRIEIFTRPGTDRLRGQTYFNFGDESLNSRNPFSANRAPYQSRQYGGNLGGPLSRKSSFFLDVERREIDENAVVHATILDANLLAQSFSQALVTPLRRLSVTPRIDYQLTPNHTLVFRYQHSRSDFENQGIGQFNLASRAYDTASRDHSFQVTETAVLSPRAINETRFQFLRGNTWQTGDNTIPTVTVLDSFTGGGAQVGLASNRQNRYELTNTTSITSGTHYVKFGGRFRHSSLEDISPQNFGGTFTFAGGLAPVLDANNQIVLDASGQPIMALITSLERYRRTLLFQQLGLSVAALRQLGGGASQFTLSAGNPLAAVRQADVGLFMEDSWRVRPNLTLNYGLRYETQTNISDYRNFAPRVSIAWGLGGGGNRQTRTVIRAGFGMFYDRFQESLTLQATRFNGTNQQQYFVTNPDFFPIVPALDALSGSLVTQTQRLVANDLRAPYIAQTVVGVDRQLPKNTTVSANFIFSRGVHLLRTRNINAPDPATGLRPLGEIGNIYLYESSGKLNQRQLLLNFATRFHRSVALFGFYALGSAKGDTDGVGSFPVNQYDLSGEYGRSSFDVRQRFLIGGSLRPGLGVSLNPFVMVSSGAPFNIITGRDVNGDTIFNDRPSFATDLTAPGVVLTKYGAFNLNPAAGETLIPRNYGQGPMQFTLNLRLSRTWGFGSKGETPSAPQLPSGPPGLGGGPPPSRGGGPGGMFDSLTGKRYNLTLSVSARNLLNRTNLGTPIGNLSSPLFGESNSLAGFFGPGGPGGGGPGGFMGASAAGNRRVEVQLRLSF